MQELDFDSETMGNSFNMQTNVKEKNYKHCVLIDTPHNFETVDLTDNQLIELRDFLNIAIKEIEND